MSKKKRATSDSKKPAASSSSERATRRCGLCGKTRRLTKSECCGRWICDDEDRYVLFSFARNSCYRNHRGFTLCGYHHAEGHAGSWKECPECRKEFETELYVHFGTNEYNFETLADPPAYEPTRCSDCGSVIRLGEDGYTVLGSRYRCETCAAKEFNRTTASRRRSPNGA